MTRFSPLAAGICLLAFCLSEIDAQRTPAPDLFTRICRFFKIDPRLVKKSRQGGESVAGQRLMQARLDTKRLSLIWDCGGCSSPILIRPDRLAVLVSGELWTVGVDGGSPNKECAAPGIEALVGADPESAKRILVLARVDDQPKATRLRPVLLDISTGRQAAVPQEINAALNAEDAFESFQRPDAYHGSSGLTTSTTRPWHVQIFPLNIPGPLNEDLFAGWPQAVAQPNIQRFAAIWIDDNRIAFLELP